jgi:hypothetical protein
VGRRVLEYVQDPGATIMALAGLLRSGGLVAFDEFDCDLLALARPPSALLADMWRWQRDARISAGDHMFLGLQLRRLYLNAGLVEPEMQVYATVHTPEKPTSIAALRSLMPLVIEAGIATAEQLDLDRMAGELSREYESNDTVGVFYGCVQAWAHKP